MCIVWENYMHDTMAVVARAVGKAALRTKTHHGHSRALAVYCFPKRH